MVPRTASAGNSKNFVGELHGQVAVQDFGHGLEKPDESGGSGKRRGEEDDDTIAKSRKGLTVQRKMSHIFKI
jgi:hypothetical protein